MRAKCHHGCGPRNPGRQDCPHNVQSSLRARQAPGKRATQTQYQNIYTHMSTNKYIKPNKR